MAVSGLIFKCEKQKANSQPLFLGSTIPGDLPGLTERTKPNLGQVFPEEELAAGLPVRKRQLAARSPRRRNNAFSGPEAV